MFENILGQPVTGQLSRDLAASALAPSMLFAGPPASGKGAAALELGRILSCENSGAPWNCSCSSCARHRFLIHPDLLILGSRPFSGEIAAAAAAFSREPGSPPARFLFIRSVRKLLARFSPVLWEDDPKLGKLSPLAGQLEESLDELDHAADGMEPQAAEAPALKKVREEILKNAFKLEAEGMGEHIPIVQIRRAAWWSRLAPSGKRKLLLIENADRMQEGARNSLLKILEEPPETVSIVLSSSRPEALLPTIVSRLRPYRFIQREPAVESAVIRRVFRDPAAADTLDARISPRRGPENDITVYLDSFLPVSGEILRAQAAFFAASVAASALVAWRKRRSGDPQELILLGKLCAPIAEAAGLGRPRQDTVGILGVVLKGTENFEIRSLFPRFLNRLLELVSESFRSAGRLPGFPSPRYYEIWRQGAAEAGEAVGVWNQSPALTLERLAVELSRTLAEV